MFDLPAGSTTCAENLLVVLNFLHLTIIEVAVFLGTFRALEMALQP